VRYSFRSEGTPISRIDMDLGDYSRDLRVEGSSAEQVDALVAAFDQQIEHSTTWFGGTTFRIWVSEVMAILGMVLTIVGLLLVGAKRDSANWEGAVFALLGLAAILLLLFAPWAQWLPGTAIYSGDPSFIKRQEPLFALVGAVVAIGAMVWEAFKWAHSRRGPPNPGSEPGPVAGRTPQGGAATTPVKRRPRK